MTGTDNNNTDNTTSITTMALKRKRKAVDDDGTSSKITEGGDSSPTKKKRAASDCVPDTATSTVTAAVVDANAKATADDIVSSSKITDGSNGTTIAATATILSPIVSSSKITDDGNENRTNKKRPKNSDGVSAIAAAAQAEDMVSQLKLNCKHLGVEEDAFNHLDQIIRLVRNAQAKAIYANGGTTAAANMNGKGGKKKPILMILPDISGKLSNEFKEFLLPVLRQRFDVRLREKKWEGWNPLKNAIDVSNEIGERADGWYIMGFGFGSRVAATVAALPTVYKNPPKLILIGFPMYGPSPNNKDERVLSLQVLPVETQVLAISGTQDEFITSEKNVAYPLHPGNPRDVWDDALKKICPVVRRRPSVSLKRGDMVSILPTKDGKPTRPQKFYSILILLSRETTTMMVPPSQQEVLVAAAAARTKLLHPFSNPKNKI